jgi:energy-coupling factor transporter transmembrane protein EcfT
MAELTSFSYHPGLSLIHKIDARFKLFFIAAISVSSLNSSLLGISMLFMPVFCGFIIVRISFLEIIKDLYILMIFLIIVFAVRAFSTDGVVLYEGLVEGSVVSLRIILIALLGMLFTSTTRTADVKAAIDWILKPFPFNFKSRISTMTGLMMRFIPIIMEQARETSTAQKARCIENRKNPIYRTAIFSIPLLGKIFNNADRISMAMEARCYSDIRTGLKLSSKINDWIALSVIVSICIISVLYL